MGDGGLAETQRDGLRERVRERYAEAATTVLETGRQASCCDSDCGADQGNSSVPCCGPTVIEVDETFGGVLYSLAERDELPVAAVAASLGCGNPTAVAKLHEGERVLDLGSGGGIDVLLSARRVGVTPDQRAERGSYVGCVAGALSRSEYLGNLAAAGFSDASVRFTQRTADSMHSAIIQATKPR